MLRTVPAKAFIAVCVGTDPQQPRHKPGTCICDVFMKSVHVRLASRPLVSCVSMSSVTTCAAVIRELNTWIVFIFLRTCCVLFLIPRAPTRWRSQTSMRPHLPCAPPPRPRGSRDTSPRSILSPVKRLPTRIHQALYFPGVPDSPTCEGWRLHPATPPSAPHSTCTWHLAAWRGVASLSQHPCLPCSWMGVCVWLYYFFS